MPLFPGATSPLLTKQSLEVSSKGELVILRIGNVELPMHYEHALDVSRWMRKEARVAKALTGRPRTARSLGTLEDLGAKAKPLPYTAGQAIHSKPKLAEWHREDVKAVGRLVQVKIGLTTFSLHFENALKISQWLRVRAKESRNRAGDIRHWSEISKSDESE